MKHYLTHTTIKDAKIVQTNLGEFESSAPTHAFDAQDAMSKAARTKFGEGNWKFKNDKSLTGCYVVCIDETGKGDTIHVDPFPVE